MSSGASSATARRVRSPRESSSETSPGGSAGRTRASGTASSIAWAMRRSQVTTDSPNFSFQFFFFRVAFFTKMPLTADEAKKLATLAGGAVDGAALAAEVDKSPPGPHLTTLVRAMGKIIAGYVDRPTPLYIFAIHQWERAFSRHFAFFFFFFFFFFR
jgi:hypothetical protein